MISEVVRYTTMDQADPKNWNLPAPRSLRLVTAHRSELSSWVDCGFTAYPVGGTGRKIEQVSDVQVDLPSTRVFRRPCYDAWQLAADC
jgi:hypothetical protein